MIANEEKATTPKKVPVVMIHHCLRPNQNKKAGTDEISGFPGS